MTVSSKHAKCNQVPSIISGSYSSERQKSSSERQRKSQIDFPRTYNEYTPAIHGLLPSTVTREMQRTAYALVHRFH